MHVADIVVFVSSWLRDYYLKKYRLNINSVAILNGVDRDIFTPGKSDIGKPIRVVTHHWSNNYYKGFHIYNELDKYVGKKDDIEFVYIGNYNLDYVPKNTELHPPTSGVKLAKLLQDYVYI